MKKRTAKKQITISNLTPEQHKYVSTEAKKRGLTMAGLFKIWIADKIDVAQQIKTA